MKKTDGGGSPQMADDGAGVDDRYKTSSNELQHVPTPDSRKPNKCVVVE